MRVGTQREGERERVSEGIFVEDRKEGGGRRAGCAPEISTRGVVVTRVTLPCVLEAYSRL